MLHLNSGYSYTRVWVVHGSLHAHVWACLCVKRVSVYFSRAHFRPCVPLCCISLSLCHLLVFLSVWKPSISKNLHLWKCLLSRSFFLSSCLRTLPIWNPACDSSTRRGKRWSRLRAPCPQSRLLSQDLAGWSWGTAHSRRQCRTSWKLGMWSAWSSHFCPLQVLRLRGNSSWLIPWRHGSSIL